MCEQTPPAQLRLPDDASAPGVARRFLRQAVCELHAARVLDAAELLVSEVVTNGLVHGSPPVVLRVQCDGSETLRVAVSDASEDPPVLEHAGDEAVGGRGVELVDLLSDEWGVVEEPPGKTVWFTLTPR
jgi:anti-sigma regulatory factor (Ser/Thr protein kinase)